MSGPAQGSRPERPASAAWLAQRRAADNKARNSAAGLLTRLVRHLTAAPDGGPVHVYDLGAGTGANRAYLELRLGVATDWTSVDHDPLLLRQHTHGNARRVLTSVDEIERLVTSDAHPRRLLTCSALLDILTLTDLDRLANTTVRTGTPALFSLTVTGRVRWTPADPSDGVIARAFDAHQRRAARAGPQAASYLGERLQELGCQVEFAGTPWQLDARRDGAMMRTYVMERASVAAEQNPSLRQLVGRWSERRRRQLLAARLTIEVDHVDLLALPAELTRPGVARARGE